MNLPVRCLALAPGWLVPRRHLVRRGDRRCGRIALTFDDGPNPTYTPKVLDLLDAYDVKATFFLVGQRAERQPDLTREIARRGHAVGNHTYSHANLPRLPPQRLREEMDRGRASLEDVTGLPVRLFRPPWGYVNLSILAHARRVGMRVVLWSVDSRDWARNGEEAIWQVLQRTPMRPGDIVLFHDDYPETVAVLPRVLENLRRSSVPCGSLGDLVPDSAARR
jgi:peptidoglycan/xylan/chitin deacetylase (PgdA/CDA1 family)